MLEESEAPPTCGMRSIGAAVGWSVGSHGEVLLVGDKERILSYDPVLGLEVALPAQRDGLRISQELETSRINRVAREVRLRHRSEKESTLGEDGTDAPDVLKGRGKVWVCWAIAIHPSEVKKQARRKRSCWEHKRRGSLRR